MLATSSRCSFRNQSMNWAPTRSFSSRASAASRRFARDGSLLLER
jgi:hypothetical protein